MSAYIHPGTCGCPEHFPELVDAEAFVNRNMNNRTADRSVFWTVCHALVDIWNEGVAQVGRRSVRMTDFEAAEDLVSALFFAASAAALEAADAEVGALIAARDHEERLLDAVEAAEDELMSSFSYWSMLPSEVQQYAIADWLNGTSVETPVFQNTDAARLFVIENACQQYGYADSEDATFGADDISLM